MNKPKKFSKTPCFANQPDYERTGSDSYRDFNVKKIVWVEFNGWALTSPADGGGELEVISTNALSCIKRG